MHPLELRTLLPKDLRTIHSLEEYKKEGGLTGLAKARSMDGQAVIDLVKKSGLRGRGGAGFPAAIKWQTVLDDPCPTKYVVCNMAEGEPGTYKDRYFLSKNPYLVFEGMLIIAHAIGARQAVIGTKEKFKGLAKRFADVIQEYEDAGICEPGFLRLVLGPDEYLFGEEKALLEVIDGRYAMPRFFPPFMLGVDIGPGDTNRNPAVVNNAESMSHLPHILSKGPDWFRSRGTADTPGTAILSLSGDIKRPGVYEVATGLTVNQMLYDLGGGPVSPDRPIKALFSGVSNAPLTPERFNTVMDFGTLRSVGFGLGSCGFMVYDQSRCMVNVAWLFSKFLASASCGQCIPCNGGTRLITERLENILDGRGTQEDLDAILSIAGRCTDQTRCFLPQQEQLLMRTMIKTFPNEFQSLIGKKGSHWQDLQILKIKDFDESAGQFIFEEDPVEFRVS